MYFIAVGLPGVAKLKPFVEDHLYDGDGLQPWERQDPADMPADPHQQV